ncbi:hypothetical protein BDA99DRAFT_556892 [Phascolomyces articulosus]|uniref:Heterokaryon incompatibility domain-containing protein n=1 Tax=Phascolomyces articulosus TaxID=60185 RepID=A0AAD5KGV9_9FUNG|nr:hypothetical protein BDA99DRAFT_556892 [Phascolomyces articulosus]
MYITYETAQYSWVNDEEVQCVKPPITIPNDLPKPDFMPTKLVRISDMKVIDGSQVNEGYCTLSYSWNQSGDMVLDKTTGKYKRTDEGKHKIIFYDNIYPDMIIPYHKTFNNMKFNKIYEVFAIMEFYNYCFTKTIKYVKFEGIIQQICQQFNIKYIWYDQLCINQDNKEEKHHEISHMHHLYENAYCTVALVPDFCQPDFALDESKHLYFKRLWTLEEAIKSERLLFVGRNTHQYGDNTRGNVTVLAKSSSELNVSEILYHAHQRTSTNDHDRVFALIHLFPEFIDHEDDPQSFKKLIIRYFCGLFSTKKSINKIRIDYNQPFEDMMNQFYGLLAKKDLSILLFGKNRQYESTIEKYKFLPSWTGVNGHHFVADITTSFQNYDIIGKTMHITTTYVPSIDGDKLTIREEDIRTIPYDINDGGDEQKYRLCILVQLPETNEMKRIALGYYDDYCYLGGNSFSDKISKKFLQLSRFMEVKKENLCWYNKKSDVYRMAASIDFDDLTDNLDDSSAQYVILSEASFKSNEYNHYCYPVIKKEQEGEYYKAIGSCWIESNEDFFSGCNLNKETFLIQ